jgi:redox-sensitive bicupin YhaK (pirin superfamily)
MKNQRLMVLSNANDAARSSAHPIGASYGLVMQYGPFVMNTREEIDQAVSDYRNGQLI